MALEFDEQLSRLEKPNRNEMTNKEYAVFNENVETMEKNWGFINNLFKVLPLNASQYSASWTSRDPCSTRTPATSPTRTKR